MCWGLIGQAWFPQNWTETDIKHASEYIANLPENANLSDGVWAFGEYNGVRVGIIKNNGEQSGNTYLTCQKESGGSNGTEPFLWFIEEGMFLDGWKELSAETGNEFYESLKEWTNIPSIGTILWGVSNPGFGDSRSAGGDAKPVSVIGINRKEEENE